MKNTLALTSYQKRLWLKSYAQNLARRAIKNGFLKKGPCEKCPLDNQGNRIEAHHDDYTMPFAIRWLCKSHHHEAHGKISTHPSRMAKEKLAELAKLDREGKE